MKDILDLVHKIATTSIFETGAGEGDVEERLHGLDSRQQPVHTHDMEHYPVEIGLVLLGHRENLMLVNIDLL